MQLLPVLETPGVSEIKGAIQEILKIDQGEVLIVSRRTGTQPMGWYVLPIHAHRN